MLVLALLLSFTFVDVTIFSHRDEIILPTEFNPLSDSTFLSCGVLPVNANFVTRWITPSGNIVTPNTNNSRFIVLEGNFDIDRRNIDGTALILMNLSYQDEGVYICESRDQSIQDSPWVQAFSFLELIGIGCIK